MFLCDLTAKNKTKTITNAENEFMCGGGTSEVVVVDVFRVMMGRVLNGEKMINTASTLYSMVIV